MAEECSFSTGFSNGFEICVAEPEAPAVARGVPGIVGPRRRLRPVELEGRGLVPVLGRGELSFGRGLAGEARIVVQGTERFARSLEFGRFIVRAVGVLGLEHPFAGEAQIEATASGTLTREVSLVGEADAPLAATGMLAIELGLGGTAAVAVTSDAELEIIRHVHVPEAVELEGEALVSVVATGALDIIRHVHVPAAVELEGEALVSVVATGILSIIRHAYVPAAVELEGAALVAVVAFGELGVGIAYAGAASQAITATGVLSVGHGLEGWVDLDWSAWGEVEADDEETTLAILGLPSEVVL